MKESSSSLSQTLRDLYETFMPNAVQETEARVAHCLQHVPTEVNEYGYDIFGFSRDRALPYLTIATLLYEHYFRVESHGIENVPKDRVLLVANHAGQIPTDAILLTAAMLVASEQPRLLRGMGEYWLGSLPWLSAVARQMGNAIGTPETCARMLEREESVLVFPEGVRGLSKSYAKRYQLQRFGSGFMRLALSTETPIVPVGVIGTEEQQPGIANLKNFGRKIGMPALPITLGFPLFGPLGLLPLPVKVHLQFGEPMRFEGDPESEEEVAVHVEQVKQALTELLDLGLSKRKGIFS